MNIREVFTVQNRHLNPEHGNTPVLCDCESSRSLFTALDTVFYTFIWTRSRRKMKTLKVLQFCQTFLLIVLSGDCYPQAEMDKTLPGK